MRTKRPRTRPCARCKQPFAALAGDPFITCPSCRLPCDLSAAQQTCAPKRDRAGQLLFVPIRIWLLLFLIVALPCQLWADT